MIVAKKAHNLKLKDKRTQNYLMCLVCLVVPIHGGDMSHFSFIILILNLQFYSIVDFLTFTVIFKLLIITSSFLLLRSDCILGTPYPI